MLLKEDKRVKALNNITSLDYINIRLHVRSKELFSSVRGDAWYFVGIRNIEERDWFELDDFGSFSMIGFRLVRIICI